MKEVPLTDLRKAMFGDKANAPVPQNDIEYFLSQDKAETERIVAGMTTLIEANEEKLSAMQGQNWFQRICLTVSGKNKATVKEMEQNRGKLTAYIVQIISIFNEKERLSDTFISSLAICLNDIYFSHLQFKEWVKNDLINEVHGLVGKLNKKIESIDNFHNLITDIQNGDYTFSGERVLNLLKILMFLDNRAISDKECFIRIKKTLERNGYDFSQDIDVKSFVEQIIALPEENIGEIYMFAQNHTQIILVRLICCLIEQYHFEPKSNRKIIKEKAIKSALRSCGLGMDSPSCNIGELYKDIYQSAGNKIKMLKQVSTPLITDNTDDDGKYDEDARDKKIIDILLKYFPDAQQPKLYDEGIPSKLLVNNNFQAFDLDEKELLLGPQKEVYGIVDTSESGDGKECVMFLRDSVCLSQPSGKPIRIFLKNISSAMCFTTIGLLISRKNEEPILWSATSEPIKKLAHALEDISSLFR